MSQLVTLQLADELDLEDPAIRDQSINWLNGIRDRFPNTILYMNNYGGQVNDSDLIDFTARAQPDMLCFDTYPWRSVYDPGQPNSTGPPIGGPPTSWYAELRRYRDISKAFNIPFGSYSQTFAAVETWDGGRVYRHPTPSELRLNMFAALAFNAKVLIDFTYNSGASSLFDRNAEGHWLGDGLPNALYYEKADANLRARNFGKALVRLKPIADSTTQCDAVVPWTTSVMFIRGRDSSGALNAFPINFCAGPGGGNPNTDWVLDRNDPYLRGWSVSNTGTKNNGYPGDVLVSWFQPLDESFDGPDYSNQIYIMVVNGLTDTATNSMAADCAQEIKLNFHSSVGAVEMLNPLTGVAELQLLPLVDGLRQLVLNLNGGDAALFKFATGAPFVGVDTAPVTGAPVMTLHPASRVNILETQATFTAQAAGSAPLSYQWQLDGVDIAGATNNTHTRTGVQFAHAGSYTVAVSNSFGTVTSTPAVLTVLSAQPFFYEPFDYPNIGGPVTENTPENWAFGGTGANDLSVVSGSLSYPGLAASIGNSVTNGGVGLGVRRLWGTTVSGGDVYVSVLFSIDALGTAWNGNPSSIGGLTQPNNTTFSLNILVRTNTGGAADTYVFGLQKPAGTQVFDSTPFTNGETVLLVGRYAFNEAGADAVSLWINPSPSDFGSALPPPATLTTSSGNDSTGLDRFNLRQNTAASVPAAMRWDELRVGYSWGDVTPFTPAMPTLLTNVTQLANGGFQFEYVSGSGRVGSVYASTDLIDWIFIGVPAEVEPGWYQFTDNAAIGHAQRYYQLRWP